FAVPSIFEGEQLQFFKPALFLPETRRVEALSAVEGEVIAPVNYEVQCLEHLENWFTTQIELQKRFQMVRGCPFGTVANEITEEDELIRQDLSLIFQIQKTKLAAFFIAEKAKGRIVATAKPDDLAEFCVTVIQGAMLMGKVHRYSKTAETTVKEAMAHLKRYATS